MTKNNKVEPKKKLEPVNYIVVHHFKDSQDGDKVYKPSNTYDGAEKSEKRIKELTSSNNKIGVRLIKLQK